MTTPTTCQREGCRLPVHPGHQALCILHDPLEGKDLALFNQTLKEKIQREESDDAVKAIDLSGVVFPDEADFRGRVFTKAVSFQDAQFRGLAVFGDAQFQGGASFWDAEFRRHASFNGAEFHGGASFGDAEFHGDASFNGAEFRRHASFWGAEFQGAASFWDAEFHGGASFGGAGFHGGASFGGAEFRREASFGGAGFHGAASFWKAEFQGAASFNGAEFHGDASFGGAIVGGVVDFRNTAFPREDGGGVVSLHEVRLQDPQGLRFEGVDLSRVSFLRTDLSGVRLVGDITWPHGPDAPWWPVSRLWRTRGDRTVLFDHLRLDAGTLGGAGGEAPHRLIGDNYRQLRMNLESSKQEIEAGDFYIGQMDMRRRDPGFTPAYRGLITLYRFVALYGESYLRPLALYYALAAVLAAVYLVGGFEVNGRVVDYAPLLDPGNAGSYLRDYARALFYALTAGALLRGEITTISWWVPLVQYLNMLADILLLGLALVALRRRFQR